MGYIDVAYGPLAPAILIDRAAIAPRVRARPVRPNRIAFDYIECGENLSGHHPDEPRALDDCPDSTALMVMGASGGSIGEILFA
jgi:hypothetical protein